MEDKKIVMNIDHLKPKMQTLRSIRDVEITASTVAMAKADGEFTLLVYKRNDQSFTINRYGHYRSDFPALDELVEAVGRTDLEEAEILCELHAVDDCGKPLILPNFIHYAKGHDPKLHDNVHIGVWDLVSINGVNVVQDFEWKLEELSSWLRTEDGLRLERAYVLPYRKVQNHVDLKDFWDRWVEKKGYEGLVVRSNNEAYKIKPIRDVDAVIIALNKVDSTGKPTKRWAEKKVSSIRVALMDREGVFVELGDCTVANPEYQSALWELHTVKVSENPHRVYVKPLVVCEIQYTSLFEGSLCNCWKFLGWRYLEANRRKFFKMRHPRFVRLRPDKQVTPEDLRLEQLNGE